MIYVEGGSFMMGSNDGRSNEKPVHKVTVSSFIIGKYQVTQKEWKEVMGTNPSYRKGDNLPVEQVSWYSAIKYCNLRSMAEGLTPVYSISGSTNPASWGEVPTSSNSTWNAAICNWIANGYRLPTEAEWEYAARGGIMSKGYKYSGSDNIDTVAWYTGNSGSKTHAVGTKTANELGIYDMSGNVSEWCWDWYGGSYYSGSPANNQTGPTSGSNRVQRGCGWSGNAYYCRVTYRDYYYPSFSSDHIGIRLCRAVW
ncbi:MAG: formylglycine-generating enzyme family protein [Candidatus Cloacimonetes bacterium]|nr:formylglycine-generating enzyme family protein [Candidatus Cloacimonadota bacterium]